VLFRSADKCMPSVACPTIVPTICFSGEDVEEEDEDLDPHTEEGGECYADEEGRKMMMMMPRWRGWRMLGVR